MSDSAWKPFRGFTPLIDPRSIARGPVLVFAPHPDDEVIGCGGALAFHVARGDRVHVVHVTGGEAGDPKQTAGGDLIAVRLREAKSAAAVLGLHELRGLRFPDGKLTPSTALVDAMVAEIDRVAPAIVYAPSLLECHPDHLATGIAAGAALARSSLIVRLFGFEVNHPTLASFLLDVTPWIDRKREALAQFTSQLRYNDLIGRRLGLAYARTMNIDLPGVEYAEAFMEVAPARITELLRDLTALHERFGLP